MHYQADVVVIGGGPAGICAALAAARENRSTILITDRPVLGGNSSSEVRVWTRGATGAGNLFAEEMGIWGELKLKNLYRNPEGNPVFWDDVLLDSVLAQDHLMLFLNTCITAVEVTDNRVYSVSGFQMASEKMVTVSGKMFVDATGDGTIGALAGIPYHVGKESREEYQESFAPVKGERTTFGNTIFYFTARSQTVVKYKAPDYAYSLSEIETFLGRGGRIINEKMDGCDYWWFEIGGIKDTIADAQEIALDLKRLVAGVWNYIKNSGKFEADYLTLSWQGNVPGKRESRRMLTETIVKQQDVLEHTRFADTAFYGGWYMDFHPSDGIHTEEDYCVQIPVQVYSLPFSALYNRKVENLLFAGRDIGSSHVAFASSRIMNTCALSGQAAGVLAAESLRLEKPPADLAAFDISYMQQKLIRDDMLLPGIPINDEQNLVMKAQIQVSSVETGGMEQEEREVLLKPDDFLVLPSQAGEVKVLLRVKKRTALHYDCYAFDLPTKLALAEKVQEVKLLLNPGKQWIALPLPDTTDDRFWVLAVTQANDIEIITGKRQLTGFLGGNKGKAGLWYPCIRFGNPALYAGENLRSGYNRPWKKPNLWISKEEEAPYIVLTWQEEVAVSQVELFFNPDLSLELNSSRASSWSDHHMFEPRLAMPPQLVRDFRIYGWDAGSWKLLREVTDNWKRKVRVDLAEPYATSKIKIQITASRGVSHGEVFEVRVY